MQMGKNLCPGDTAWMLILNVPLSEKCVGHDTILPIYEKGSKGHCLGNLSMCLTKVLLKLGGIGMVS